VLTIFKWFWKRKWLWLTVGAVLILVLWLLSGNVWQEEQKELRQQVRESVKEAFPEEAVDFARTMGLFFFTAEGEEPGEPDGTLRSVILIHGMDDPGKVWRSLAPELAGNNCNVWLMQYPNDQPIVESSRLFYQELKELRLLGIDRISIVTHSMGGLVSRDLLTCPEFDYGRSAEAGHVPHVDQLIMVAPPNQGSQLARFREFGELRDQYVRLTRGQTNWLGSILDGLGEAKIDLLPDSRFLTELNSRPHPKGVEMLIIAGVTSPWTEEEIDLWVDTLRPHTWGEQEQEIDRLGGYMVRMTHGLGDGLVTVDSTRLEGVPHLTVQGTHLSMIRNITADNPRVPPSVPIIVERLTPPPPDHR
jgi:pimeloyl-ACP methyl ester carboxylesterase